MANYHKGRRLEWEIKKLLEAGGYTVTRAAGSKGPWDLVATKRDKKAWFVILTQCKLGDNDAPEVRGMEEPS